MKHSLEIKKVDLTNETLDILVKLSEEWENENSCFGYHVNSLEDIQENDAFLMYREEKVVGYLLAHIYDSEKETCTISKGSRCLEIEEIFIRKTERSKGLGQVLFNRACESYDDIDYVTLTTATKNYKAILHFYIEELDMTFWNAKLFKKTDKTN